MGSGGGWWLVVGRSWTYQTEAESDRSLNFKGSSSGEEKDTELSCFHFLGLCGVVRNFQEQYVEYFSSLSSRVLHIMKVS